MTVILQHAESLGVQRNNYQRKKARSDGIVAIKTVAHKLARACYFILRDGVDFDVEKAFA